MSEQNTSMDAAEEQAAAQENAMTARLRQAKDLTSMTVAGTRSTISSTADMAAGEATASAEAASSAAQTFAQTLGEAVAAAIGGVAHSTGAMVGGVKGATGGLILAAQIGGGAAVEATKALPAARPGRPAAWPKAPW